MALTYSNGLDDSYGVNRVHYVDLAFDSSYPTGGESLGLAGRGFEGLTRAIIEPKMGYTFEYDHTNNKVKVFAPAPPIVFEEVVTCTTKIGTLKYPAAYIMYVGSANAAYKVIPGALTPVTGSVAVSAPAWGVRPTITFYDSITTAYVTYVTQAWKEVFDNYVQCVITAGARVSGHASASFTAATPDVISLGELAVAIECITWNDNATYKPMIALYKGATAATTEATIDFSDTTTKIAVLQTDTLDAATDSVYINYIKHPGAGTFLGDRFIEEDDLTPSSDVSTFSSGSKYGVFPLIYGTCGDMPSATTAYSNIIRSGGTIGATATLIQPTTMYMGAAPTFTHGSSHADTTHIKPSYVVGNPHEIPGLVPLEVVNATSLAHLTGVKATLIGW